MGINLYRGKLIYKNEWIYGSYLTIKNSNISKNTVHFICPKDTNINECHIEDILVDFLSVGRYTGLTDKINTKIFEGDIVSVGRYTGIVKWDYANARYDLYQEDGTSKISGFNADTMKMALVIGNIYDKLTN